MSEVLAPARTQVRIVTVGHVDHGKSTLIGRLLHDTGNIPAARVDEIRAASDRRGVPFEWSFLLDALQSERDQAITIDTSRLWLRLPQAEIVLIDAPGHKEFIRNMVTGASDADAALLVVDAFEGVSEQTRRHSILLELLGIRQVVVAVNKMDRVDYDERRFEAIRTELAHLLERLGVAVEFAVPVSARSGENVTAAAGSMSWYRGPHVLDALLSLRPATPAIDGPLRIPIQGIVRRGLERIAVGRVESGTLTAGAQVVLAPSGRAVRVESILTWPDGSRERARAGESIGIVFDGPVFVDRGDVVAGIDNGPSVEREIRARLLWLDRSRLVAGRRLTLRSGTRSVKVEVSRIERVIDIESLDAAVERDAEQNDIAEVLLRTPELVALDTPETPSSLSRFILVDGLDIVGGGTVLSRPNGARSIVPIGHLVNPAARAARNGHAGAVVWLTGPPASGKSTLAIAAERKLFERGYQVFVLDGDNLRSGLNSDLGFAPDDRVENIRRAGEVAALFAQAGFVVIAAFISPYAAGRAAARAAAGKAFHEVYVHAAPAIREGRDPKGHYQAARAGNLPGFTGVTGEYEPPETPDLAIDTGSADALDATAMLVDYIIAATRNSADVDAANL